MRRLPLVTLLLLAVATGSAHAATYYVSPSGSDANLGTTPGAPWRTVNRTNNASLQPGDSVLFQGGTVFGDAGIMPPISGAPGSAITYSSYGGGRATISNSAGAVWLPPGRNYLTFDNLVLTTANGSGSILADSGSPPGSSYITVANCLLENGAATGIGSWQATDTGWSIRNSTIRHIGDSAIALVGKSAVVSGDTISDVGWNASIPWAKHGIYAKGPNHVISGNDIADVPNGQAVSIRSHGTRVFANAIHDTPYAAAFFDYDTSAPPQGTSYIYSNRAWNISGWFFYYSGQLDPQGNMPSVGFVLASNTVLLSGATEAINVLERRDANVTVSNNLTAGSFTSAFSAFPGKTAEFNNLWSGGSSNVPLTASDLREPAGVGSAPQFTPTADSNLVDRGATAVDGLQYANTCNGTPLSYCGARPDIGAVELATASTPIAVAGPAAAGTEVAPPSAGTSTNPAPPAPSAAAPSSPIVNLPGTAETSTSAAGAPIAPGGQTTPAGTARSAPKKVVPKVRITRTTAVISRYRALDVSATATSDTRVARLVFFLNGIQICVVDQASGSCRARIAPAHPLGTIVVRATDSDNETGASFRVVALDARREATPSAQSSPYARRQRTSGRTVAGTRARGDQRRRISIARS